MGPTIDIAICFDRGIESAALVLVASLRHHAAGGRAMRVHAVVSDVSPGVHTEKPPAQSGPLGSSFKLSL